MDLLEAAILDTITSAPNVSIDLHTNLRQFRTARELIKDGHGNYICGAIELNPAPLPDQTLRLELSLVPVEEAAQKQHMLHPNLLSVNIKEQNRIKFKSDLTSAQAWKVVLWIKNGDVLYQDPVTGTVYTIDKLFEGNKILLGNSAEFGGQDHLLLTIVTPLQSSKDGTLSVENVIQDRIANDKNKPSGLTLNLKTIANEYCKGKDTKKEMRRCRLRVCLYQDHTDEFKIAEAYSETIKDSKDKNFGNFQVACMSEPHSSCENGGWKHFLVAKAQVGQAGFFPIFVFANGENDPEPQRVDKIFPGFKQISTEKEDMEVLHHSTFRFKIPSQQKGVVQSIKHYYQKVYITLYRQADDEYASGMIKFDYHDIHANYLDDEECHYCEIKKNMPLSEVRKDNQAKRKKCRRRNESELTTSGFSEVGSPMTNAEDSNNALEEISNNDFNQVLGQQTNSHILFNPEDLLDLDLMMRDGKNKDEEDDDETDTTTEEYTSDSDELSSSPQETEAMDTLCETAKKLKV